ncbi:MAG: hypothetical protein IKG98_06100 [Ruminococcus sp.]|nr:hypothetical protein [Ruminococcus sp.]MBR6837231.1 hypothetical protein [Oscillospiraceae bacterium]
MQNVWKLFKKHWITIWLIIAVSSLFSLGAYAAYTRITIAKRVVSTDAGVGDKFSSNVLKNAVMRKTIKSESNPSNDVEVDVYIYNYVYPKEYTYRNVDTTYKLIAKLGTISDQNVFTGLNNANVTGKTYKIEYTPSNPSYTGSREQSFISSGEAILTFSNCKLSGGNAVRDVFTLTFDKSELGDTPNGYWMELTAIPDDNSLPKLVGYIKVQLASGSSTGWTGKVEDGVNADSDGFIYVIEGNGTGKFTFKWDPTQVTISRQFLQNKDNTFVINGDEVHGSASVTESMLDNEGAMKKITIKVDSLVRSRYEVQFYKYDSSSFDYSNIGTYLPPSTSWVETSDSE